MSAAEKLPPYDVIAASSERADWLTRRKSGVGASEIACVLGVSSWKSPLELYAEKVGLLDPKDEELDALEMGVLMEPVILARYRAKSGRWAEHDGRLLRSREHPWALCTLDARTRPEGGAEQPLELKNWSAFAAEEWADGAPEPYVLQAHQQMLVLGTERATVACLLGGVKLVWCDVPRDEQEIRRIVYAGERFWERVRNREPPPADAPGSSRALRKIYPDDDGNTIELPGALREVVDELEALKEAQSALKSKRERLEASIQEAMGSATRGLLLGHSTVTWKTQQRRAHSVEAGTSRVLRISRAKAL